eukprot:12591950-Alexandrium_andersonii.AAC.1
MDATFLFSPSDVLVARRPKVCDRAALADPVRARVLEHAIQMSPLVGWSVHADDQLALRNMFLREVLPMVAPIRPS